jgi:hypothetical protein
MKFTLATCSTLTTSYLLAQLTLLDASEPGPKSPYTANVVRSLQKFISRHESLVDKLKEMFADRTYNSI